MPSEARYAKPSDLIAALGYDESAHESILDRCDFATDDVTGFNAGQLVGWATAEQLCRLHLGHNPAAYIGDLERSYRVCLEALVLGGK